MQTRTAKPADQLFVQQMTTSVFYLWPRSEQVTRGVPDLTNQTAINSNQLHLLRRCLLHKASTIGTNSRPLSYCLIDVILWKLFNQLLVSTFQIFVHWAGFHLQSQSYQYAITYPNTVHFTTLLNKQSSVNDFLPADLLDVVYVVSLLTPAHTQARLSDVSRVYTKMASYMYLLQYYSQLPRAHAVPLCLFGRPRLSIAG